MHRLLLLATVLVALPAAAQPRLFAPADDARLALSARQSTLLGYLEAVPATVETHLVRADLRVLDEAAVLFNLASDAAVTLTRAHVERRADGASYQFRSSDDGTFALLVVRESGITGTVRVQGQLYNVRPLTGGLHVVAQMDEDRFVEHTPDWEAVEVEAAARWAEGDPLAALPDAPESGGIVQRILVPYTPNAESQVSDILALVQLAIDETNQGYVNSNVAHRVALAYTYRTPQNESSFSTTLNRMADPDDGYHDEIAGLRAQYGADLVQMIAGDAGGLCGTAFTILADGPDEGYAIASQTCATGYYTFGHELGHLQGARHNPETDPSSSPFPYGHGKYYIPGGWRTVMSYACPGNCTRVLHWSNPDVNYNGVPTGDVAQRDNARVLDETAAAIAAFFPDPTLGTATITATLNSPSTIGSGGGTVSFTLTISNTSGAPFSGEYWMRATLPNGSVRDVVNPVGLSLASGQTQTVNLTANVPARAPAGVYTATAYVGQNYPNDFDDSDSFTITKTAARTGGGDVDEDATLTVEKTAVAPEVSATVGAQPAAVLIGTYPNPFDRSATVHYAVTESGTARVAVYDVLGREVAVLVNGAVEAGSHAVTLDARGLPAGVYLVRVQAGGTEAVQHVTLQR